MSPNTQPAGSQQPAAFESTGDRAPAQGADRGAASATADRKADRPGAGASCSPRIARAAPSRPEPLAGIGAAGTGAACERSTPGELIHVDTQTLGRIERPGHRVTGNRRDRMRGIGWEFAHVAIDDHSRVSRVAMAADECKESAMALLEQRGEHYRVCGVSVQRVMTDNGSANPSRAFAAACRRLCVCHCAPGHAPRRPTARPSASSRPACANGPTPLRTPRQLSAAMPRRTGCITTTATGHTAPLLAARPSVDCRLGKTTD